MSPSRAEAKPSAKQGRPSLAARLFGYDVFLSFALGPPPRGTHAYASDLTRRLRERDLTVFFSEQEAPPGEVLDRALAAALRRSKLLVVVANRETLADPRWVRTEVEVFRARHPKRMVIPISVDGAVRDPALAAQSDTWLACDGKIWVDESADALARGTVSDSVVERLALTPARAKANVLWRLSLAAVVLTLLCLSSGLGLAWSAAAANLRRAESAQKDAVASQEELRSRLARSYRERAQRFLSSAQPMHALPFAVAARAAKLDDQTTALLFGTASRFVPQALSHAGEVQVARFSPDSTRIITASDDGTARLWDARSGKPIGNAIRHADKVFLGHFRADGERVITLSEDGRALLSDARTGAPLPAPWLESLCGALNSASFAPGGTGLLLVCRDGSVHVLDSERGEALLAPPLALETGMDRRNGAYASFSADGAKILAGNNFRQTAGVWDVRSGQVASALFKTVDRAVLEPSGSRLLLRTFPESQIELWDATSPSSPAAPLLTTHGSSREFSADGTKLSIVAARALQIVRTADGRIQSTIATPEGIEVATFSPDGSTIATGDGRHAVYLWRAADGSRLIGPLEHDYGVSTLSFSADGRRLLTAGRDGPLRVWDAIEGSPITPRLEYVGALEAAALSPDGKSALAIRGEVVLLWTVRGAADETPLPHEHRIRDVRVSPDGGRIATVTESGIHLWNAGALPASIWARTDCCRSSTVTFSSDGRHLLARSSERLEILNAATGATANSIPMPLGEVLVSAALDAEGQQVLAVTRRAESRSQVAVRAPHTVTRVADGKLRIWKRGRSAPLGANVANQGRLSFAIVSHDGRRALAVGYDSAVVLNLSTRSMEGKLLEHGAQILTASFSRDGQKVVLSGADTQASVWDIATSKRQATLQHTRAELTPEFSPDGTRLLTAGPRTVQISESTSGKAIGPAIELGAAPSIARWSSDGLRVFTSSGGDGRLWDAETSAALTEPLLTEAHGVDLSSDGFLLVAARENVATVVRLAVDRRTLGAWKEVAEQAPYALRDEVLVGNTQAAGVSERVSRYTIPTLTLGLRRSAP